jgi:hypothetical protein
MSNSAALPASLPSPLPSRKWRWPLAVLLAAGGVALVAFPGPVAKYTGYDALNRHAMDLVDETLEHDQETFLVMTAIKTSLAVITGSEVGIGFQLEIGDVVQPAYDYVDFFWRMFLYAFLILGTYKILIETGMLTLGLGLMGLGLVLLAVGLVAERRGEGLWRWGRRTLLGGALFAYAVPLALVSTHELSERYTSGIKARHLEAIRSLRARMDVSAEKFIALKGQINLLQPGTSLENLKNGMLDIATSIGRTFQDSLKAFLYYMLVIAFEVVFFPFLSAWVLYKFAQFALGRVVSVPGVTPIERPVLAR